MHIARVCERLPRLQIQFWISRCFRPRNPANLGPIIRLWIAERNTPILGNFTDFQTFFPYALTDFANQSQSKVENIVEGSI